MNYRQMAAQLDVALCEGGCAHRSVNHDRGWADPSNGVIHWRDRRVNRMGLRRFLMMAAAIFHSHNRGQPEWLRIYEQHVWAQRYALMSLHTRIPARYAATDRARVRELLRRLPFEERTLVSDRAARWAEKE